MKFIMGNYMNTFIIESLREGILLVGERGGWAKQILVNFLYIGYWSKQFRGPVIGPKNSIF